MVRLSTVLGLLLAMVSANAFSAGYTIDPAHTYPHFKISHLGFSTMLGRFNVSSGKLTMDRAKGTGSVEIEVDVNSIDTGHAKRDKHLRSPDFFNVAEFPKMTFKSTKVNIKKDNSAVVKGNLTLMGITKPITLNVKSINCGVHPFSKKDVCGFDATGSFKRSDFGMKYGLPAIGDDVTLIIEAEAGKD
ncbi:MAG: YceI family protein [Gammaproteobacteria bacterium]|nr:YceI family protein [Gammaproteobacteria bacterium]MDH5799363.1 YceI family protein [Gammaproteobacteria bacterium]